MRMKKIICKIALLCLAALTACTGPAPVEAPHEPKVLSIIPKAGYPGTEATISGWWLEGRILGND